MANPYHDSNGKFCGKSEMLSEIKTLSKGEDFTSYFNLRKAYDDIEKTQGASLGDIYDVEIQNRPRLNVESAETSLQSYELVKDKLGDDMLNNGYTSQLLGSRYLPEDIRADIIARSTSNSLRDTLEKERALSPADYQNILARPDAEKELYPVIAKTRAISFKERVGYLKDNTYGIALLAMHNPKEFFSDDRLPRALRSHLGDPVHNKDVLYAMAVSPWFVAHHEVIFNEDLNAGYPTAAMALSRNRALNIESAYLLLQKQIAEENGYAGSVASEILQNKNITNLLSPVGLRKIHYQDATITPAKRAEILKEIEALTPEAEKSFVSLAARRRFNLKGKLYANDDDFQLGAKQYKALQKKTDLTPAEETQKGELHVGLRAANNIRNANDLSLRISKRFDKKKKFLVERALGTILSLKKP